jgi:methylated-DNA-[protein]-cysteine S-methyltransferase
VKPRILVVEDDRTLRTALVFNLEREGYEVRSAVDGEQGLAAARDERLDLIVLDLMLPAMSGLEVLRTLRADGVDTPVVILSAKGGEVDRVVGLKVGADDYIAKPFSRPELLARIETVLRRQRRAERNAGERHEETRVGQLTLVASEKGLCAVLWGSGGWTQHADNPLLNAAAAQLEEYFAGTRQIFDLSLDLRGTPFQVRAWSALAEIPYGTTVSYGEQSRRLGVPRAVRAIGAANGRNPLPIVLPCHRVIGASGALTGYGGGLDMKRWLLAHERVSE